MLLPLSVSFFVFQIGTTLLIFRSQVRFYGTRMLAMRDAWMAPRSSLTASFISSFSYYSTYSTLLLSTSSSFPHPHPPPPPPPPPTFVTRVQPAWHPGVCARISCLHLHQCCGRFAFRPDLCVCDASNCTHGPVLGAQRPRPIQQLQLLRHIPGHALFTDSLAVCIPQPACN